MPTWCRSCAGRQRHHLARGPARQARVGRRAGLGHRGERQAILTANGITFDDIDEQRLNFNETADALANGDIDAGFWSVGAPTSSILNLATTKDIVIDR
jgi:uncharacterized protein